MGDDKKVAINGGVSFFGLLVLVFITLKLLKVIEWSWLWVLAPLWMPTAIILAILFICFLALLLRK